MGNLLIQRLCWLILFLFGWSGTAITIVAKFIEQINTPSPNTKTIDDDGERGDNTQLFFYHGTSKKRADIIRRNGFQISTDGMLGPGVYVSNQIEKAKHYATYTGNRDGDNGAVLVLEVRLGNVKKINYQGHPMQKTWQNNGYDTAWVPKNCGMVPSGLSEDCIKDPSNIKIINKIVY